MKRFKQSADSNDLHKRYIEELRNRNLYRLRSKMSKSEPLRTSSSFTSEANDAVIKWTMLNRALLVQV